MGVGQLSESDAVDALRLPFYSSSHPTGSHGWRNQFDLGNPDSVVFRGRTWRWASAMAVATMGRDDAAAGEECAGSDELPDEAWREITVGEARGRGDICSAPSGYG